jgi:hypothetical protein
MTDQDGNDQRRSTEVSVGEWLRALIGPVVRCAAVG